MSTRMEVKEPAPRERRVESVGERLQEYEHKLRAFLENLEANVEYYKFSVEKHGEGIAIDVAVKATIQPKPKAKQVTTA